MPRGKSSLFDLFVLLPWWISAGLAIVVYFFGPGVAAMFLENSSALGPVVSFFQIFFPILLAAASLLSLIRSWKTNRNLEVQEDIESLKRLHWKDLEDLLGEVYRRQGYGVKEQLGGGADGGVDLVLHANGAATLVQCKRWTEKAVPVQTVRELYGVMTAEKAQAGILATTTTFTSEARRFAAGKPIELVDGPELLRLVRSVQEETARETSERTRKEEPGSLQGGDGEAAGRVCPSCGSAMVLRTARKGVNAGNQFWGCSAFPKCRQTAEIAR